MRSFLHLANTLTALLALLPLIHANGRFNVIRTPQEAEDTWIHYSTHVLQITDGNGNVLNLDDTTQFSDGHLVGAASEAWREMIDDTGVDSKWKPAAMIALQVKGEIYFSSSIKKNNGGFMAQFQGSPAAIALDQCSTTSATHQYGGNCGEPAAIDLFYRNNPDEASQSLPGPSRIVAIGGNKKTKRTWIKAPCGVIPPDREEGDDGDRKWDWNWNPWGCERFLNDMNVPAVSENTVSVDIPDDWDIDWGTICF